MDRFFLERKQLVDSLRHKGISSEEVLQAMLRVPRHEFVPKEVIMRAYEDAPQQIGEGQTISQPYTVAFMTELLEVEPGDKILEIGTGSGYQAAILAEMGAQVFTVERIKKLYDQAKERLKRLGYDNIHIFYADGTEGLPKYAPFDKIIITAATPEIPQPLKEQLKNGGYIVAPVGDTSGWYGQIMKRYVKINNQKFEYQTFGSFIFVPLKKGLQ